jgi:hypothetical protein
MWAVLYENGMSLTTESEQTAQTLAHAEHLRGRSATIRRLDDVETHPRSTDKAARRGSSVQERELIRPVRLARRELISEPAPTPEPESAPEPAPAFAPEPASEASLAELAREPEPAHAPAAARRRRLALYALAAVLIVVAAVLADHWGALPRLGSSNGSKPAQVSRPAHPQRLLPPLEQPPVIHFDSFGRQAVNHARGGG